MIRQWKLTFERFISLTYTTDYRKIALTLHGLKSGRILK